MTETRVNHTASFAPNAIAVLESLRESDKLRTGRRLFETVLLPRVTQTGFVASYYSIASRTEFFAALADVQSAAAAGQRPVLHLESHGGENGIELSNGESVTWAELAGPLEGINRLSRMNLLVFLAACDGFNIVRSLHPTRRSPAWAIIGPTSSVSPLELQEATEAFYSALMTTESLRTALNGLNGTDEISRWRHRIQWAETMFCTVFKAYIDQAGGPTHIQQRVTMIQRTAKQQLRSQPLPVSRRALERHLSDHPARFSDTRTRFLMLDLFPENARRFNMTFESCMRTRQTSRDAI